jgi:hypothetical protein
MFHWRRTAAAVEAAQAAATTINATGKAASG